MVTALQTDRRQSTEEVLAQLQTRHDASMITVQKEQEGIDPATLAALEGMGREELIGLIKRLPTRITGYALQTKEEKREALKLEVYAVAMSNTLDAVKLKAANDWLDREDGKAVQRIEQKNLNVNVSAAKEMTTEEILARLASASPAALESAGVKLIGGRVERVETP